jgi:hypothetical protein
MDGLIGYTLCIDYFSKGRMRFKNVGGFASHPKLPTKGPNYIDTSNLFFFLKCLGLVYIVCTEFLLLKSCIIHVDSEILLLCKRILLRKTVIFRGLLWFPEIKFNGSEVILKIFGCINGKIALLTAKKQGGCEDVGSGKNLGLLGKFFGRGRNRY